MPKQTHKIESFHGGLNTNADPRDIKENEASSLQDINITNLGRIRTLGQFDRDQSVSHTLNILPNRGLFTMASDKKLDGTNANETFVIAYDDTDSAIDIRDSGGWNANQITTFDSDLPVFYVGDGNLRVGDGEFDDSIKNKWFGYINENKFSGLNASLERFEKITVVCVADSSDSLDGKYFDIYGADNHKTQVWIDVDNSGTSQPTGSGSYIHNIEVTGIATNDSANTVATQVAGAINANSEFSASADTNTVTITLIDSGEKTDAHAGNSGFTVSVVTTGNPTGWTQANQEIQSPTVGNCLISTPFAGSDSNGVNSSASEYIGNVADASGEDVADVQSVNLRVGLQFNKLFANTASALGVIGGQLDDDSTYYPLIGDNNVKITSNASRVNSVVQDDGRSYVIDEQNSWVIGVYITAAEYADLVNIQVKHYTASSATNVQYVFSKEEIVADCWNILVCSSTNIATSDYTLGDTIVNWYVDVTDSDSGSPSPTFWISGPVMINPVTVQGFQPGVYTFYHTYLYDEEKQESLPFQFTDTGSGNVNKLNILGDAILLNFDSYINPYNSAGSPVYTLSKRITGSRLYYKLEQNDNFYLIGELDFIDNGFKWFPEGDLLSYTMVNVTGDGTPTGETFYKNCVIVKAITPESANTIDTFKSINGYGGNVSSIDAKFKTAVVHGRRTYVGNIRQPSGSGGKNFPDRILKSQVNKFDVFPDKMGSIDVTINDGESIVKLEAYADRILQFKEKTMYIINVSENVDFLEETLENKGCSFDYHVTKTDYGIAWFNLFGVYFFDGKNVLNLLEKDGQRLLSESDWESFITDGVDGSSDDLDMGSAHIAYIPKRRQLLIKNENTDIYIYDFVLRAWMTGKEQAPGLPDDTEVTNFALNGNQELFYLSKDDADVYTWDPSPTAASNFIYITKDIDFGHPSVRKKIYKVYISYCSGSGGVPLLKYGVNGDTTPDTAVASGSFSASQSKWTQAEFKFGTDVNNCFSFRLKLLGSPAGASFEINDITIVYRLKNVR